MSNISRCTDTGHWIPVGDRLPEMTPMYQDGPKVSETVLVYTGYSVSTGRLEETYKRRTVKWKGAHSEIQVTHWMPFPEPPK